MDVYERLYEAGRMYRRVRPEKRETALHSIQSVECALKDLEERVGNLLGWLERNMGATTHGGLTKPGATL